MSYVFTICTIAVRFEPVRVKDGGTYICLARNTLGASDEITATIDVQYPPRNVRTEPASYVDMEVGEKKVSSLLSHRIFLKQFSLFFFFKLEFKQRHVQLGNEYKPKELILFLLYSRTYLIGLGVLTDLLPLYPLVLSSE